MRMGKHWTTAQCCFRIDPPSTTSAQHCAGIGSLSCVCWDAQVHDFVLDTVSMWSYVIPWESHVNSCHLHFSCSEFYADSKK